MKKLIAILFLAISVQADDTATTNLGLIKPELRANDVWGYKVNANYDIIDSSVAILNSTQTFTGGVTISSGTVTNLRSTVISVSSPTYSGSGLYVNGYARATSGVLIGELGSIGQPILVLTNKNASGNSAQITLGSGVNPFLQIKNVVGIMVEDNTSATPRPVWASQLMAGPNYYLDGVVSVSAGPNGDESVIENELYVGNNSIASSPKFAVVGSTSASAYTVLIGTTPALTASNYHFSISTNGVVAVSTTFQLPSKTLAQLQAYTPMATGEQYYCSDCVNMTVCTSTGTATPYAVASSSKTRCQ